ncbi:hypothetical protein [Falsihalocynthiibacter arcticus]|nr:hypothetical protein [Falsihalocynthiibacter arcticus]
MKAIKELPLVARRSITFDRGTEFVSWPHLHLDEGHVHVHILAMNTADRKLDANKLHAGKVAAAVHRDESVSGAIPSLPNQS